MKEKNREIISEVLDEIESALRDARGIAAHQRRIAFSLSLGVVTLIEIYLENQDVLKPGSKINHMWLKKERDNVKEIISRQVTCPLDSLKELDEILDVAYEIEKERNELAYGKKVNEEKLKEKINLFLDLKRRVENA